MKAGKVLFNESHKLYTIPRLRSCYLKHHIPLNLHENPPSEQLRSVSSPLVLPLGNKTSFYACIYYEGYI